IRNYSDCACVQSRQVITPSSSGQGSNQLQLVIVKTYLNERLRGVGEVRPHLQHPHPLPHLPLHRHAHHCLRSALRHHRHAQVCGGAGEAVRSGNAVRSPQDSRLHPDTHLLWRRHRHHLHAVAAGLWRPRLLLGVRRHLSALRLLRPRRQPQVPRLPLHLLTWYSIKYKEERVERWLKRHLSPTDTVGSLVCHPGGHKGHARTRSCPVNIPRSDPNALPANAPPRAGALNRGVSTQSCPGNELKAITPPPPAAAAAAAASPAPAQWEDDELNWRRGWGGMEGGPPPPPSSPPPPPGDPALT
ncbi:hypothetical protein INR49_005490, partial [Caranx melampygus]